MAKKPFYRNPVVLSPFMRKGGVHEVSKSGQRAQVRQALSDALDEWMEDKDQEHNKGELSSPSSFMSCCRFQQFLHVNSGKCFYLQRAYTPLNLQ